MAKTEEKTLQENTKVSKSKRCFIITPIGDPNSEINRKAFGLIKAVMEPVLKKFDYKPLAASDISSPGSINKQIIIRLYEDELVIANLTGLNPNVMYELAVRHAVKRPVIIMAETGTKLPFDLVDQRCIFYEDSLHGVEIAKEYLENFLNSTLSETELNNPIYDSIKESNIIKEMTSSDDPNKYLISRLDNIEKLLFNFNIGNSSSRKISKATSYRGNYVVELNPDQNVNDIFDAFKFLYRDVTFHKIKDNRYEFIISDDSKLALENVVSVITGLGFKVAVSSITTIGFV